MTRYCRQLRRGSRRRHGFKPLFVLHPFCQYCFHVDIRLSSLRHRRFTAVLGDVKVTTAAVYPVSCPGWQWRLQLLGLKCGALVRTRKITAAFPRAGLCNVILATPARRLHSLDANVGPFVRELSQRCGSECVHPGARSTPPSVQPQPLNAHVSVWYTAGGVIRGLGDLHCTRRP